MREAPRGNALITGAGRGIGRGIALALADSGFQVVVNDLPGSDDLNETVAQIAARGGQAIALSSDIGDVTRAEQVVEEAWSAFGSIACLVNNAGISVAQRGDMLECSPESFDRLMAINLRGPFFLTQAMSRRMVNETSRSFRSVITISSINVEKASPDRAEYCISKSGLAMMSQLFAVRLAAEGINVYEVRPGVIRTQMTAVAQARYDKLFAEGLAPIARWGEPEDIGRAVAALASGAFAYTTGEVVRVDGGLSIGRL